MEALLHVAVYAGVPAANRAIAIARKTFAEMERDGA
ncbi:MAG: 4-carboxymuconolactone decarboxylase, partial [Pseudomonadota bacterium]